MVERWSREHVLALAPDASSASAARGLASPTLWTDVGVSESPPAVWGLCAGSGSKPYQCFRLHARRLSRPVIGGTREG